jgi:hypothetical protein
MTTILVRLASFARWLLTHRQLQCDRSKTMMELWLDNLYPGCELS